MPFRKVSQTPTYLELKLPVNSRAFYAFPGGNAGPLFLFCFSRKIRCRPEDIAQRSRRKGLRLSGNNPCHQEFTGLFLFLCCFCHLRQNFNHFCSLYAPSPLKTRSGFFMPMTPQVCRGIFLLFRLN